MSTLVKVIAAPGRRVHVPRQGKGKLALVPSEGDGIDVDADQQYWFRRLRDGDVVRVSAPAPVANSNARRRADA
jgi:hypothetical protein